MPKAYRVPLKVLQEFTTEAERYIEVARRRQRLAHNDVHALAAIVESQNAGSVITAGALGRRLILSASATTALIDRLVQMGLVERVSVPGDARAVGLQATEAGARKGFEMFIELSREIARTLDGYSQEQIDVLMDMLIKLTGASRRAREELLDRGIPPTEEPTTD